ncbi:hypothetical protein GKE62_08475 [Novosphingobium sp. Gsoil 351]|nr:hypothetical protein GKE62_08475 [Novosphingobium sp. Gsoil 351]
MLAVEAFWLVARGREALPVALLLLPAVLLIVALRGALTGAAWPWIALPLALSFPVHLADVKRRGRSSQGRGSGSAKR